MKICCDTCGDELDEGELEAPRTNDDDEILCDKCYEVQYQEYCPVCEEYGEKPEKPTDAYFFLSVESAQREGIKPGVYHVLDYPVFSAALAGLGPTILWTDNFELIRECDVNAIYKALHTNSEPIVEGAEFVCECCAKKYATRNNFFSIRENWVHNRVIRNIYHRGIIQNGKIA